MLNRFALAYYLNYQFVPKPLTLINNSRNPCCKDFDYKYIDIPEYLKNSEHEICDSLYKIFRQTIERQLPGQEKPVGLLLSGGFDSAAILHILRDITDREIYTLTGAYQEDAKNLIFAKRMAQKYKTVHEHLIITPAEIKHMDELYGNNIPQPIGDNGFLSTYLMMKRLKEKTSYIFSGDGADCLFSGLEMHLLNLTAEEKGEGYAHYRFGEIFLDEGDFETIFGAKGEDIRLISPLEQVLNKIKVRDLLKRQVLLDLNFLVKNRVDYIVQAAKANGVNVYMPYLDKRFIDFAIKIPSKYLIADSHEQKYILKKAFNKKIPRAVLDRTKEGFTPPFKLWYYCNREFVIKKLIKTKKIGISENYIKFLISNLKNSDQYKMGMKIWLVLNLASWYEKNSNFLET